VANLTDPIFNDEDAARAHFEAIRWSGGRVCPHCGTVGNSTLLQGKSTRAGLYKCKDCRKPFTATMGTIYERSHIPLHKWLLATQLMCSSKKGISAAQLHRNLGFGSYRTAWFMAHRIREAMISKDDTPLGGEGHFVEADETFFGKDPNAKPSRLPIHNMNKIVALVDRTTGRSCSVVVPGMLSAASIAPLLQNVDPASTLMTDEAKHYIPLGGGFARHLTVNHRTGEYVRKGNAEIHTNTIEGFFGIFKRGMRGIYQHCGQQHLQRYLAEFDFRYTHRAATGCNDTDRTRKAIEGTIGRRLMYRRPNSEGALQAC
jgi:transposase-like protein